MAPGFGLEIAVFDEISAAIAIFNGADRIEYNREGSYKDGGLTPDSLPSAFIHSKVPVRIMIRPRGPPDGETHEVDFVYTDAEFKQMEESIKKFKSDRQVPMDAERGDGFVFGILDDLVPGDLKIDSARCAKLVEAARPFKCVFHRAFDLLLPKDALSGPPIADYLEELERLGFHGVLTSGGTSGSGSARENIQTLLLLRSCNSSLQIIAGGGVRGGSIRQLFNAFGDYDWPPYNKPHANQDRWFHSAALTCPPHGICNGDEVMLMAETLRCENTLRHLRHRAKESRERDMSERNWEKRMPQKRKLSPQRSEDANNHA